MLLLDIPTYDYVQDFADYVINTYLVPIKGDRTTTPPWRLRFNDLPRAVRSELREGLIAFEARWKAIIEANVYQLTDAFAGASSSAPVSLISPGGPFDDGDWELEYNEKGEPQVRLVPEKSDTASPKAPTEAPRDDTPTAAKALDFGAKGTATDGGKAAAATTASAGVHHPAVGSPSPSRRRAQVDTSTFSCANGADHIKRCREGRAPSDAKPRPKAPEAQQQAQPVAEAEPEDEPAAKRHAAIREAQAQNAILQKQNASYKEAIADLQEYKHRFGALAARLSPEDSEVKLEAASTLDRMRQDSALPAEQDGGIQSPAPVTWEELEVKHKQDALEAFAGEHENSLTLDMTQLADKLYDVLWQQYPGLPRDAELPLPKCLVEILRYVSVENAQHYITTPKALQRLLRDGVARLVASGNVDTSFLHDAAQPTAQELQQLATTNAARPAQHHITLHAMREHNAQRRAAVSAGNESTLATTKRPADAPPAEKQAAKARRSGPEPKVRALWDEAKRLIALHSSFAYSIFATDRCHIDQVYSDNMPISVVEFLTIRRTLATVTGVVTPEYAEAVLALLQYRLQMPDTIFDTMPLASHIRSGTIRGHESPFVRDILTPDADDLEHTDEQCEQYGIIKGATASMLILAWHSFKDHAQAAGVKGSWTPAIGDKGNPPPRIEECMPFSSEHGMNGFMALRAAAPVQFPLFNKFVHLDEDFWLPTDGVASSSKNAWSIILGEHTKALSHFQHQSDEDAPEPAPWADVELRIMALILFARYEQHEAAGLELIRSARDFSNYPVYMSADTFWGTGNEGEESFRRKRWPGQNVIGDILAYVRVSLASICPLPQERIQLDALWSAQWPLLENLAAVRARGPDAIKMCPCLPGDMSCVAARRRKHLKGPMTAKSYDWEAVAYEMAGVQGRTCCRSPKQHFHISAIATFRLTPTDERLCLCGKGEKCLLAMRRTAATTGDPFEADIEDILLLSNNVPVRDHCLASLDEEQYIALSTWKPKAAPEATSAGLQLEATKKRESAAQFNRAAGGPQQEQQQPEFTIDGQAPVPRHFVPQLEANNALEQAHAEAAAGKISASKHQAEPSMGSAKQLEKRGLLTAGRPALDGQPNLGGDTDAISAEPRTPNHMEQMAAQLMASDGEAMAEEHDQAIELYLEDDDRAEAGEGEDAQANAGVDTDTEPYSCDCFADHEDECTCWDPAAEHEQLIQQMERINSTLPLHKQLTELQVKRMRQHTGQAPPEAHFDDEEAANILDRLYKSTEGKWVHCLVRDDTEFTRNKPLTNVFFKQCGIEKPVHSTRLAKWDLALQHKDHGDDNLLEVEDASASTVLPSSKDLSEPALTLQLEDAKGTDERVGAAARVVLTSVGVDAQQGSLRAKDLVAAPPPAKPAVQSILNMSAAALRARASELDAMQDKSSAGEEAVTLVALQSDQEDEEECAASVAAQPPSHQLQALLEAGHAAEGAPPVSPDTNPKKVPNALFANSNGRYGAIHVHWGVRSIGGKGLESFEVAFSYPTKTASADTLYTGGIGAISAYDKSKCGQLHNTNSPPKHKADTDGVHRKRSVAVVMQGQAMRAYDSSVSGNLKYELLATNSAGAPQPTTGPSSS